MHHFALISTDGDSLGLVAFARGDWLPGDVIPHGGAGLLVLDVVEPTPRELDGLEVGLLQVEPLG